jgi:photosystem II stability/assembly factor-like uncharacterized protein
MLVASLIWVGCRSTASPMPAQQGVRWIEQLSSTEAGLRGVSAVSADVAWASGTAGTCLRTVDGGRTWVILTVPGAERLDFRDVEALNTNTAWLMATAGRIYRTTNGGATWQLQLADDKPGIFLDAIAFWDKDNGIAFGDPAGGAFLVLITEDGGAHWRRLAPSLLPPPLAGEAGFAGSGTCLAVAGTDDVWFGTGGSRVARVFHSSDRGHTWQAVAAPVAAGTASAGVFGLAFRNRRTGVAVGGDYKHPQSALRTAAVTRNGGRSWQPVHGTVPGGYRSGVAFAPGLGATVFVAVGTSGADISRDDGTSWNSIYRGPLNAVSFAAQGPVGWAVGPDGRIVRIEGTGQKR